MHQAKVCYETPLGNSLFFPKKYFCQKNIKYLSTFLRCFNFDNAVICFIVDAQRWVLSPLPPSSPDAAYHDNNATGQHDELNDQRKNAHTAGAGPIAGRFKHRLRCPGHTRQTNFELARN